VGNFYADAVCFEGDTGAGRKPLNAEAAEREALLPQRGVVAVMIGFEEVVQNVEMACRKHSIHMLGPEKARFLHELIVQYEPRFVVECGTAIGYSGLHIGHGLRKNGAGRLLTLEIDEGRAGEAGRNFSRAGLDALIEVRVGDACGILETLEEPVDFFFLDNRFSNYFPCFQAIRPRLTNRAILVADNVGIGESTIADYLDYVRNRYESSTHWFDTDLPWVSRDAMEVTRYRS
jgi:predicted O-methyltransferase YrrM